MQDCPCLLPQTTYVHRSDRRLPRPDRLQIHGVSRSDCGDPSLSNAEHPGGHTLVWQVCAPLRFVVHSPVTWLPQSSPLC